MFISIYPFRSINTLLPCCTNCLFAANYHNKRVNLKEIQKVVGGETISDAILRGVGLRIDTWGAFASVVVDPINVDIAIGGATYAVRDSSFALGAELRSAGSFAASVEELVDGTADVTPLEPEISIPLAVEIILDLPVSNVTISPMLEFASENVIVDFGFDNIGIDVDLEPFLDSAAFGNGKAALEDVLNDVTSVLVQISDYAPALSMGSDATPVGGLFKVISQASNFVGALQEFLAIVEEVDALIPTEVRSVVRHAGLLSKNGCKDPSASFIEYSRALLGANSTGDFRPCDHLAEIQNALFNDTSTPVAAEEVSFQTLVVVPSDLAERLSELLGGEADGELLLDLFGSKSLSRLISFVVDFLSNSANATATLTEAPSMAPSMSSSPSALPSLFPSDKPSVVPSTSPSPSAAPSVSSAPSISSQPSGAPSDLPSGSPSSFPSLAPSISGAPSALPSYQPSSGPTIETRLRRRRLSEAMPVDIPEPRSSRFSSRRQRVELMREVEGRRRSSTLDGRHRMLLGTEFSVTSFLSISFDANFGDGTKQIEFGIKFDFDADER